MVSYCVIFENDGLQKNAGIQLWLSAGVFGVKENPNPSPVENGFGSFLMVRERGLEPPRRNHTHLKRACLPFQHSRKLA